MDSIWPIMIVLLLFGVDIRTKAPSSWLRLIFHTVISIHCILFVAYAVVELSFSRLKFLQRFLSLSWFLQSVIMGLSHIVPYFLVVFKRASISNIILRLEILLEHACKSDKKKHLTKCKVFSWIATTFGVLAFCASLRFDYSAFCSMYVENEKPKYDFNAYVFGNKYGLIIEFVFVCIVQTYVHYVSVFVTFFYCVICYSISCCLKITQNDMITYCTKFIHVGNEKFSKAITELQCRYSVCNDVVKAMDNLFGVCVFLWISAKICDIIMFSKRLGTIPSWEVKAVCLYYQALCASFLILICIMASMKHLQASHNQFVDRIFYDLIRVICTVYKM